MAYKGFEFGDDIDYQLLQEDENGNRIAVDMHLQEVPEPQKTEFHELISEVKKFIFQNLKVAGLMAGQSVEHFNLQGIKIEWNFASDEEFRIIEDINKAHPNLETLIIFYKNGTHQVFLPGDSRP